MYARTEGFCTRSTRKATRGARGRSKEKMEKMEETRGLMQNDARASCRATELRHRRTREFSINSARKEISWDLTALDERSFQWICPFRENEGSARSLDALLFFFFPWNRVYSDFKRDLLNRLPPALSIRVSLRGKKIGIYLSTMYNFFSSSPANLPAFVNFSRRNNFRRGWNEARTIPRKGIKIQYEFTVGTLTSRSNFSVLLLGRGHAVYRDVQSFDFNLLLKLRPLPPRGHIARASYVYYERIRGPAFRSPAFTLRVAHLCIV